MKLVFFFLAIVISYELGVLSREGWVDPAVIEIRESAAWESGYDSGFRDGESDRRIYLREQELQAQKCGIYPQPDLQ